MSLSLDDKLLGEKVNNYCSSSEDEGETDDCDKSEEAAGQGEVETSNASMVSSVMSRHPQTGPKGVISDYRHYKALEQLKELDIQEKMVALAKQNTHACRSYREDVIDEIKDKKLSELLDTLEEDDEFLTQYRQNRMLELKNSLERLPVYGKILDLNSETFVHEIDSTDPGVTVLVLIYELDNEECKKVHACFQELCTEYSHIKFCRIRASDACLSYAFSRSGVPAIVVYKNGEVIGNLLRVTRHLGAEFYTVDLENFLVEHGFLPDKTVGMLLKSRLSATETLN
ncbi:hypothetical protein P879_07488 [Paragonimus westermani]|uniref:Phosducin domain-containing protein n=1 Tax=Paragonimus westermani TaxID=34504 RepID=A0A8T0DGW8_9TREM|nr:hypothetical protein P879_07488 [Paragonimus westermani]